MYIQLNKNLINTEIQFNKLFNEKFNKLSSSKYMNILYMNMNVPENHRKKLSPKIYFFIT